MRMKCFIRGPMVLLFLTMLAAPLMAQISIGPKIGANFTSLGDMAFYNNDRSAVKYNLGGFAEYNVMPFLDARAELLYFQEGGPLNDYYIYFPYVQRKDVRVTSHNLQIPLIAQLSLPSFKEKKISPKLLIGGYYSYAFQYRERYTKIISIPGLPNSKDDVSLNVSSMYNRSNVGYLVGLGANLKLFGQEINIDCRYTRAINNVNSDPGFVPDQLTDVVDDDNKLFIGTFSVNAGLTLFKL
jgi:hypothetical protein